MKKLKEAFHQIIQNPFKPLLIASLLLIAIAIFTLADAVDEIDVDVTTYGIESGLSDIATQIRYK